MQFWVERMKSKGIMMKLFSILILVLLLILLACKDSTDCDCSNAENHAPVVQDIFVNPPPPVSINASVEVTAVAVDADGDNLTYLWSSSDGEFFMGRTNENPTHWIAPGTADTYTITCTVNDSKSTGSKTISIIAN